MIERVFTLNFLGTDYQCLYITHPAHACYALQKLQQKECLFSVDTETEPLPEFRHIKKAGLNPYLSRTRLIQVCDGENALVFDLHHLDAKMFIPFLETKRFVAHNALFDLQYFTRMGVKNMNIGCTQIIANHLFHACYPDSTGLSASLADLVEKLLGSTVL